jgi:hypothetical protein
MIVPTPIPWSTINPGQVYSADLVNYWMKCDSTNNVNLSTGVIAPQADPTSLYTVFPGASVVLS